MTAVRIASLCVMLLCWWWLSFFSGIRKRKRFAAAVVIFHILPLGAALAAGAVRSVKLSDTGIIIDQVSLIISRLPYLELEAVTGVNGMYFSAAMAVICLVLFSAGYTYTCRMLAEQADIKKAAQD